MFFIKKKISRFVSYDFWEALSYLNFYDKKALENILSLTKNKYQVILSLSEFYDFDSEMNSIYNVDIILNIGILDSSPLI